MAITTRALLNEFQFHNGSIKRQRSLMLPIPKMNVSIPQWFD